MEIIIVNNDLERAIRTLRRDTQGLHKQLRDRSFIETRTQRRKRKDRYSFVRRKKKERQ